MISTILVLLALVVFAFALGWQPHWDHLSAVGTGGWNGAVALFKAPVTWQSTFDRALAIIAVVLFIVGLVLMPVPGPGNSASGAYGDTRASVIAFQQAHGLTPDGIWGPATNAAYQKGL